MRRVMLVLIGVVVLVVALFGLAFASLHSGPVRAKIEATLSSALGQPVKLGELKVVLLPTPTLEARDIRIGGADSNAAPGLALISLHATPQLSSFLPGRTIIIDRVELDGLTLAIRKNQAGKWLLPVPPPTSAAAAGGGRSRRAIALPDLRVRGGRIRVVDDSLTMRAGNPRITTITDIEADLNAVAGTLRVPHFSGKLGRTTVNGSAEVGPKGKTLHLTSESIDNADLPAFFALATIPYHPDLAISGKAPIELTTTVAPDFKTFVATGKASVQRVTFGTLVMDGMSSSFRYEKGVFTLAPLSFTFFGGKQQGTVSVDFRREAPVYTIQSNIVGLDVNRALSATTTMKAFLLGSASLTANVRGSGSAAQAIRRSLTGTVKVQVSDGVIKNLPLLAAINRAIGTAEGTSNDTKFQSLSATAAIGGGKARTNDLLLRAGELSFSGSGELGFDQTLDFQLRALVSAAKSQQLLARLGPLARLQNQQGEIEVPVVVTGTTRSPRTRVDVASVAKAQLQQELHKRLEKLFQEQLFHR